MWKKIEMCEGPYRRLVAWLESVDQNSAIVAQDGYDRWAADECSVLEGIAEYDLADIFLRCLVVEGCGADRLVMLELARRYLAEAHPELEVTACR